MPSRLFYLLAAALLALLFRPDTVFALTTTVGGVAYDQQCTDNGVPSPPPWGKKIQGVDVWKKHLDSNGDGMKTSLIFWDYALGKMKYPDSHVYYVKSAGGICVAMARAYNSTSTSLDSLGIICAGNNGKVCYWDSSEGLVLRTGETPIVSGSVMRGGIDLNTNKSSKCSSCHTGDNPFIVIPNTAIDVRENGVSLLNGNGNNWPDPIVPINWPKNPVPTSTSLTQCTSCHKSPAQGGIGRLPDISSGVLGYCESVVKPIISKGFMPPGGGTGPFAQDIATINALCAAPRSPDMAAPKGRFAFADRDMNIYAIDLAGNLVFYKHTGFNLGSNTFSITGNVIGNGWGNFKRVFSGGSGIIYAINASNELLWYKHTGTINGSVSWAPNSGTVVGSGWAFDQVFATNSSEGAIYAVAGNGDLLWYRHTGRNDGSPTWHAASGSTVGWDWGGLSRLVAAGNGIIYGVNSSQSLLWYKHSGFETGAATWAGNSGAVVATGWSTSTIFAGYTGLLYAVNGTLDLQWNQHLGHQDGTNSWTDANPRNIALQWDFLPVP